MTRASEGLAVLCDTDGLVLNVMCETSTLSRRPQVGSPLSTILAADNGEKLSSLFDELADRGSAFDWSINVDTPLGVCLFRFAGTATEDGFVITAAESDDDDAQIVEQFVSMNSELVNSVRDLRQRTAVADVSLQEFTQLNNSLVNLQRELTRKNGELERSEHLLQTILSTTPDLVYIFDLQEQRFTYVNSSVVRLLGFSPEETTGHTGHDLLADVDSTEKPGVHRAEVLDAIDGQVLEREYRVRNAAGEVRLLASQEQVFARSPDSTPAQILGVARDITERKLFEEELERRATTDSLTTAANRHLFMERAAAEIRRAARHGRPLAFAVMDIDDFKAVNDTCGHAVGDLALVAFAEVCRESIRDVDLLARLGGDEFALVLVETDCAGALEVVNRIQASLTDRTIDADGDSLLLEACAGVSSLTAADDSIDSLLARADKALYRAKNLGRNCAQIEEAGLRH